MVLLVLQSRLPNVELVSLPLLVLLISATCNKKADGLAGTDAAAKLATCCDANKVTVPAPTPTLLAPSPTVVEEADTGGAPTATVSIAACAVVLAAFFM